MGNEIVRLNGSRREATYNELIVGTKFCGRFWGKITDIKPSSSGKGLFVCINGSDTSLYYVDEVTCHDWGTRNIVSVCCLVDFKGEKK